MLQQIKKGHGSSSATYAWTLIQLDVAHLSIRNAQNTTGTRGPRSDTRDLWRRW
jgi:hypothetical protein